MLNKIKVMPLGGGQNIGSSCYYLRLGDKKFLLDCGNGYDSHGILRGPIFQSLIDSGEVVSLSEIDAIFISHAHYDHLGFLPVFTKNFPNIPVYATCMTKSIGKYIMNDGAKYLADEEIRINKMLYYIHDYNYFEKIDLPGIEAMFYPAGHIAGAAMIYIKSNYGNVLYTGDFSPREAGSVGKYILPDEINPDVVIMCGVHAKHPDFKSRDRIDAIIDEAAFYIRNNESIYLHVKQLTKGMEFVNIINKAVDDNRINECTIFYDEKISKLAQCFNEQNMSAFSVRCRPYHGYNGSRGIYIGSDAAKSRMRSIEADFSLHGDYEDICTLAEKLNPKTLMIVHTAPSKTGKGSHALERRLMNINVCYPENGKLYNAI